MKKQTFVNILVVGALLISMFWVWMPAAPLATAAPAQSSPDCGSDPAQVGCWLFSEGSGDTTADGSGNSNTGALVGNVSGNMWTADRFGNPGKALP